MKSMGPTILVLVAASAVLFGGCRPAEKAPPVKSSAAPAVERKTVEFEQRSPTDLREHMAQWAREGWLVHSLVTVTQANGTVLRRAELSRPQSP